ncbi:hypothetical protein ABNF97_25630 [Plantactinospora sp. B6F1]|uniref:hypothetical protein n=1 Tax=Plantactinospora sp. B6F1 TaxID=3158971 RepID=UPI0032D99F9B
MRTYKGLIAAARARNTAFLAALTEDEIVHLNSALEKLATLAIGMERAGPDHDGRTAATITG